MGLSVPVLVLDRVEEAEELDGTVLTVAKRR